MLDPDHRNHLNRFRSTLWEIHPITKIEVWKDNQWVDVDTMKVDGTAPKGRFPNPRLGGLGSDVNGTSQE